MLNRGVRCPGSFPSCLDRWQQQPDQYYDIDNVQIAMVLNGVSPGKVRIRALDLLKNFGVGERSHNMPSRLSEGEQQRVAIARALANNPAVLLGDEPTAALDSERAKQIIELLGKIAHEQDAEVIVVTHVHRFLKVFDAICEMEDGKIHQSDPRTWDLLKT